MSFQCGVCGQPQIAGTKPTSVVVLERDVRYQVKPKTMKKLGLPRKFPFTKGRETVKEVKVCGQCYTPNFKPLKVGGKTKEVKLNARAKKDQRRR